MTCNEVQHVVEAIAAGEIGVDAPLRGHFESCPRCAAALASAQRIEHELRVRPVPLPPPRFTAAVLARIRNDRWLEEQRVDRIFNVAIALASVLVVGALAALTNVSAVLGVGGWLWGAGAQAFGQMLQQAVPTLLTYAGAIFLLMSTVAMWWWAERRLSL